MAIKTIGGNILVVGGSIAASDACCCKETATCPDGTTRTVPDSVSVSISVSLTLRRTDAACADSFPPAVNGTYVLPRIAGINRSYGAQFGNLFIGFGFDATITYSLLQFIYCVPAGGPCFLPSAWILEQTYPTFCNWPNAGAGSVANTDLALTSAYSTCITSFIGRQNDYSGTFTVLPL